MSTPSVAPPLFDQSPISSLAVEHVCDLQVDLEPPLRMLSPLGPRATYVIRGGRLEGPKLRGDFLPGGGDWVSAGSDGISRLDVRATIRTDDGALIQYESRGLAKLTPDDLRRWSDGGRVPFTDGYVRATPLLLTGDERYAWVNESVLISHAELSESGIDHRIYRVL